MVEQHVALDGYLHGIGGALADQRATGKPSGAGFDAVVDGGMNLHGHVEVLIGLIDHYAADRLAFVHQVESIVDFLERHRMRNQIVDIDFLIHVPVHDPRHLRAAAHAAEGRSLPHTAGHQLKRARLDGLAGARDADDDGHAPTAVAALERLAHDVDVPDALEAVVRAAVREGDEVRDQVAFDLFGVDEVGHAEFLGQLLAARIDIDAHDLVGAYQMRALDHIQADPTQAEHHHVGARLDLRGFHHGADAGGHAAADIANLVERRILAEFRHRDLGHHREIGERRASHVVVDHLFADVKTARGGRDEGLALGGPNLGAKIGLLRQAGLALATLRRVQRNDVVAFLEGGDAGPDIDDDAGTLVAKNHRKQSFRVRARAGEFIGMANAGRLELDEHFAGLRSIEIDRHDLQRLAGRVTNSSFGFHSLDPLPLSNVAAGPRTGPCTAVLADRAVTCQGAAA